MKSTEQKTPISTLPADMSKKKRRQAKDKCLIRLLSLLAPEIKALLKEEAKR